MIAQAHHADDTVVLAGSLEAQQNAWEDRLANMTNASLSELQAMKECAPVREGHEYVFLCGMIAQAQQSKLGA